LDRLLRWQKRKEQNVLLEALAKKTEKTERDDRPQGQGKKQIRSQNKKKGRLTRERDGAMGGGGSHQPATCANKSNARNRRTSKHRQCIPMRERFILNETTKH